MPGPPPKPDGQRIRRHKPAFGWVPTTSVGWQHGETPKLPPKLTAAARDAWDAWMGAWFAAHWLPEDLPALRQLIRLYDQVERGEFQRHAEMRIAMDTLGISHRGQMQLRWQAPVAVEPEETPVDVPSGSRYEHLKSVQAS